MFKKLFNLEINKVVGILIAGNVIFNMADGFLSPIFAIFVVQKISPGDVETVGFAIAIYWLVKSVIQIPIAKYLDKTKGENDDLFAMLLGGFMFALIPLLYIFARDKYELFAIQGLMALAGALVVIPWHSIFTRHIDSFRIGFEWSLNSSSLGLGLMVATATGGFLAKHFGFNYVFVISSAFFFGSVLIFSLLYKFVVQKDHLGKVLPETVKK